MSDYRIPELPSDEELGIAGLSEEDFAEPAPPPPGKPGKSDGGSPPPPKEKPTASAGTPRPVPWRGWATLVVLLAGAWISSSFRSLPSPRPASAPDTVFSSGRALATVAEMARRPHPPGSPEHDRVRGILVERLRGLGLEPEIQEVTQVVARRDRAQAATVRNILARIPGTASTGAVVLTAHYDAVPQSPGAGDDATGVSAIIEAVRALRAGEPLRNDVFVLLTDAEEVGLMGARAFVSRHPWMTEVRAVLSVEMRGAGGPSIMFETGTSNGWIVERLRGADPHPLANSVSQEIYRRLPNDTDFSPFRDAGIQGLNFGAIGRADRYHQPTDTPENLQEATLQHHGDRLLAMVRDLGGADLAEVHDSDRAFTVLPFVGMVTLPSSRIIPITLGILGLLLLVTFLASLRGTRSRGFLLAAVLSALAMALSAGAGWALLRWFVPLLPGAGADALATATHGEGIYFLALGAMAFAVTTSIFSLGHRWMTPLEATLGALLIPVLALVGVTLMAPVAAINLQGPMASTLLLLALLTGVGLHRARGVVAWVASVVLALPVLAFLVPVLELASMALTLRAALVLGALYAFSLLFLLPALSALDYPNRWWAPASALALAAALLGMGWLRAGPSPERPVPVALVYALDRDADGASAGARWATLRGAGLALAAQATGQELQDPWDGDVLGMGRADFVAGPAAVAAVRRPEVSVLRDTIQSGRRRVRLGIRSAVGAEMMRISLPDGVEFVGVDGAGSGSLQTEVFTPAVRRLDHWGRPSSRLEVELDGPAGADWGVEITEHHFRPRDILGESAPSLPADAMPHAATLGDRAILRGTFRIPAPEDPSASPEGAPSGGEEPGDTLQAADSAMVSPPDTAGVGG